MSEIQKENLVNDVNDFIIEDSKTEQITIIDPLEKLVNHDFSSDDEINLDESYEMLTMLEKENDLAKAFNAENIIKELEPIYVSYEYKEKISKSFENIKSFIKKYNIEKEEVKNLSDDEKTKLFAIGTFLNKNIASVINEMHFNIIVTREEYKFIDSALKRISYDGNDVFNMVELNDNYLKKWREIDKSLSKDVNSMLLSIDIKNSIILYHFLSKYTVKGIDKEFYIFASVLKKIADVNNLFNAYNILKERINIDFRVWSSALDENKAQNENNQSKED